MRCKEINPLGHIWIIGYGNPQRGDDGIGPYIVSRLDKSLAEIKTIRLLSRHQLEPELIEEFRNAVLLIFIDACVNRLEKGWKRIKVKPDLGSPNWLSHHCEPAWLLGLLQSLYHRTPPAFLISVQGKDFGLGEGLSPETEETALRVEKEIVGFLGQRATAPHHKQMIP